MALESPVDDAIVNEFFTISTRRAADGWVAWSDALTKNDESEAPIECWAPTRQGAIAAWLGYMRDAVD